MLYSFEAVVGLLLGNALSTVLFNLCLEKVIRKAIRKPGRTIFNTRSQCLLYADDVVVLGCAVKHTLERVGDMTTVALADWTGWKCVQNQMYD